MQTPPTVDANGVRVTHMDGILSRTVRDYFRLQVPRGQRVHVQGPSEAGKATLLLLLCGLQSYQSGEVHLFGLPLIDFHTHHTHHFSVGRQQRLCLIRTFAQLFLMDYVLKYLFEIDSIRSLTFKGQLR